MARARTPVNGVSGAAIVPGAPARTDRLLPVWPWLPRRHARGVHDGDEAPDVSIWPACASA